MSIQDLDDLGNYKPRNCKARCVECWVIEREEGAIDLRCLNVPAWMIDRAHLMPFEGDFGPSIEHMSPDITQNANQVCELLGVQSHRVAGWPSTTISASTVSRLSET